MVPALALLAGGAAPSARAQGISFAQPLPSDVPTVKRKDKDNDRRVAPAEQAPGKDAEQDQARRPAPAKSDKKKLRCARPPCSA